MAMIAACKTNLFHGDILLIFNDLNSLDFTTNMMKISCFKLISYSFFFKFTIYNPSESLYFLDYIESELTLDASNANLIKSLNCLQELFRVSLVDDLIAALFVKRYNHYPLIFL